VIGLGLDRDFFGLQEGMAAVCRVVVSVGSRWFNESPAVHVSSNIYSYGWLLLNAVKREIARSCSMR
jgi:hypothetical protein